MRNTRLGDLLVDAGVITRAQLSEALVRQQETKERLGATLINDGIITEQQLIEALTVQLGIDYIDLSSYEIDPALAQAVPKNLAKKHAVVPVRIDGPELYLAMSDPLNFIAAEEVRTATRKRIVPVIATASAIERAISALYGTEGAQRAIREMQQEETSSHPITLGTKSTTLGESEQSAPSIRLVDSILERGIAERASDIHIEPQEDSITVRMRIDGMLHNVLTIPKELQSSVTSRIKIMCNMDVTERRTPQDGRAIVNVRMKEADLRVSTLPTVNGEKVVLRILDHETQFKTAEELGFSGLNLSKYRELLRNRTGVILFVGPTGSGKSSTMSTMIHSLNTESVNIVTLEDPVEYNIGGVNQVQVDERAGMTFARGLRAVLRQDPDIVSVGEIRDAQTAQIAMRAAITGHLVLSTLHTNDAVGAINRLLDIGVEPFLIADALRGVIAQRLVRTVCPHCRETYEPSADELERLGIDLQQHPGLQLVRGTGCTDCFGTGYRGRTVVAEVLTIDRELRRAIHEMAPQEQLRHIANTAGFVPLGQHCRELVLAGITTSEEALRTMAGVQEDPVA